MTSRKNTYYRKSKKRRKRRNRSHGFLIFLIAVMAAVICVLIIKNRHTSTQTFNSASNGIIYSVSSDTASSDTRKTASDEEEAEISHSVDITIENMLLTPNEYSRPQIALSEVNGIVVHYTANPGTTAEQNRNYFEELQYGEDEVYASSHFVIGLDGEIIQCIPLNEISYASNDRNYDTISIECCHLDESGEFTDATYQSLVNLTTWLCEEYNLTSSDVIRHYDITGKICPKYFVENEDAWDEFLSYININLN